MAVPSPRSAAKAVSEAVMDSTSCFQTGLKMHDFLKGPSATRICILEGLGVLGYTLGLLLGGHFLFMQKSGVWNKGSQQEHEL